MFDKDPISRVEWVKADELTANDYNPNVVLNAEMKLIEYSILMQGWIQPILITNDNVIIDGFHRWTISRASQEMIDKYDGMIPVVRLDLTEAERMMLTIRINRAKGNHRVLEMHKIVYKLHHELGVSVNDIKKGIGANAKEVDLLLKKGVMDALDIKNHEYSKAWEPKK